MYELKEILTKQNIELPTSMYKIKPINIAASADNETSASSVKFLFFVSQKKKSGS